MKKHFSLVVSLLSAAPFAFWDMGDRFTIKIDEHKVSNYSTQSIYPNTINYQKRRDIDGQCGYAASRFLSGSHLYSFLYESHTGYVLLGLPDSYPENFQYFDDGLKNLSLTRAQLEVVPNGYYTIQSAEDIFFKLSAELEMRKCIATGTVGGNEEGLQKAINEGRLLDRKQLGLETTIFTSSRVEIKNEENKVELKRNSLNIELKNSLMEYFSQESANSAIVNAINYSRSNLERNEAQLQVVDEATRGVREINSNNSILERLKNSKILKVYNVLPDENNKESILFGLAENLASHRKFFWITQLKDDLSILLKG